MSQPDGEKRTSGQFCWIAGLWEAGLMSSGPAITIGYSMLVAGCAQR